MNGGMLSWAIQKKYQMSLSSYSQSIEQKRMYATTQWHVHSLSAALRYSEYVGYSGEKLGSQDWGWYRYWDAGADEET